MRAPLRFAVAACSALLVAPTVHAQAPAAPAASAASAAPTGPTVRAEIAPPLQAAQKALADKQYQLALQQLQLAEAVPGRTAYETYVLERMRFLAAAGLSDTAGTLKALEAALATEQAEPAMRAPLMDQASSAAYALKDYAKSVLWARRVIDAGARDDSIRLRLGQALYLQAQYPEAAQALDDLTARQRSEGRLPGETQLRLQASSLLKMGDEAGYARVLEDLLQVAPQPAIWSDRLVRLLRQPGFDEALVLDLLRLSRRVGALANAQADLEYAELALRAGFPAEALTALDAGDSAARLGQGADAAAHKTLRERAQRQAAEDRAAPAPDAPALLARDPTLAFNAGWAQYTAGQRAPGIALMRQALERGPLRSASVRLRLAAALADSGDAAQARTLLIALRDGRASDGSSDLARLSLIALGAGR